MPMRSTVSPFPRHDRFSPRTIVTTLAIDYDKLTDFAHPDGAEEIGAEENRRLRTRVLGQSPLVSEAPRPNPMT